MCPTFYVELLLNCCFDLQSAANTFPGAVMMSSVKCEMYFSAAMLHA